MEKGIGSDESLNCKKKIENHKFIRRVDKKEIPTCNILGVNIAAINMHWLLSFLQKNIKHENGNKLSGDYICVSNVHTTVLSYEDKEYCDIQNSGLMAIPDGGPLATLGRKRGSKKMDRVAGPTLMEEIFNISIDNSYTHYFYGSTEETLDKLCNELKKKYPGINIVGSYSPPFRSLTEIENKEVQERINLAKPDFVWVGLGAPKQEKWMSENQGKVNSLMIGVGAGFDYFAGNISRAPKWMQRMNMEWLYRLFQEPKRLFKRYMYTNTKFIWLSIIMGK
ncbi:WecB/TagA/CpsF family glycosyltransferase [Priestia megaterium]|uniref:WecB/TagA/CpsF family glycosyltransferase n=1 Tax=Priestia megaterium TaxID=1404 RepID=UPI001C2312AB|nr:WecB/TagA/CpsF family glycosyltransferase [Priestia megaterium]MBU8752318.1 WecB/TagA/CpsF family glycosyltransferase [Priestia megaterium]